MPYLLQHYPHFKSQPSEAGLQDLQTQVPCGLLVQVVLDIAQVDLSALSDSILTVHCSTSTNSCHLESTGTPVE